MDSMSLTAAGAQNGNESRGWLTRLRDEGNNGLSQVNAAAVSALDARPARTARKARSTRARSVGILWCEKAPAVL